MRRGRWLITATGLILAAGGAVWHGFGVADRGPHLKLPGFVADRVVVDKSDRRLDLMAGGDVMASFAVALGGNPVGQKGREGDGRTPEGSYILDWRNPNSRFHLSIHVSYPNDTDKARAQAAGVSPGGDIMVHGHGLGFPGLLPWDWTDGCIAVANGDMDVIWAAVPDGTPIEIRP